MYYFIIQSLIFRWISSDMGKNVYNELTTDFLCTENSKLLNFLLTAYDTISNSIATISWLTMLLTIFEDFVHLDIEIRYKIYVCIYFTRIPKMFLKINEYFLKFCWQNIFNQNNLVLHLTLTFLLSIYMH